jgi:F-type H+-transporting ATPase subunit a
VAVSAAAGGGSGMPDPIHQFEIHRIFPQKLFGYDVSFTNSSLFMVTAVILITGFFMLATRGQSLVPARLQSIAEITYEFLANMVRENAGEEGMRFFPFVFSLFTFIFACNMLGMIPATFTVTSHLAVTAALALAVFLTVLIVGFARNGLGFLRLFVPSGVPIYVLPLVTLIEIISFLSRPISHSVRLFANMLAGHITLKVFGGFIVMLLGAGGYAALSPLPFLAAVALTALEFLVAFLQAYVFTMLTCMYLSEALDPGH